MYFSFGEQHCI